MRQPDTNFQRTTQRDVILDLASHTAQITLLTSAMASGTSPTDPATRASTPLPLASSAIAQRRDFHPHSASASIARAQLAHRQRRRELLRQEKDRLLREVAETASVPASRLLHRIWDDEEVDLEEEKLRRKKREGRSKGGLARVDSGWDSSEGERFSDSASEASEDGDDDDDDFYDLHVSFIGI